nr:hypothetical protein [Burkholderia pseudomallei]
MGGAKTPARRVLAVLLVVRLLPVRWRTPRLCLWLLSHGALPIDPCLPPLAWAQRCAQRCAHASGGRHGSIGSAPCESSHRQSRGVRQRTGSKRTTSSTARTRRAGVFAPPMTPHDGAGGYHA